MPVTARSPIDACKLPPAPIHQLIRHADIAPTYRHQDDHEEGETQQKADGPEGQDARIAHPVTSDCRSTSDTRKATRDARSPNACMPMTSTASDTRRSPDTICTTRCTQRSLPSTTPSKSCTRQTEDQPEVERQQAHDDEGPTPQLHPGQQDPNAHLLASTSSDRAKGDHRVGSAWNMSTEKSTQGAESSYESTTQEGTKTSDEGPTGC